MENKEKITRLKKEIAELEAKKKEQKQLEELFDKRNRLKFNKLYATGGFLKKMGSGLSEWAEEKNKELKKDSNTPNKKKPRKQKDIYDELFGGDDLTKQLGF